MNQCFGQNRMKYESTTKNQGFTLVEMIMVVIIMGILAVTIIPRTGDLLRTMNLKAAGDKIEDDIRFMYEYAVAMHDTTWLVVNISNNSYGIYSGPSQGSRQLILDPSTNRRAIIDLDDEFNYVSITAVQFSGSHEFYYDWWGTPSSGGSITLNGSKVITVAPGTGYVYETQ